MTRICLNQNPSTSTKVHENVLVRLVKLSEVVVDALHQDEERHEQQKAGATKPGQHLQPSVTERECTVRRYTHTHSVEELVDCFVIVVVTKLCTSVGDEYGREAEQQRRAVEAGKEGVDEEVDGEADDGGEELQQHVDEQHDDVQREMTGVDVGIEDASYTRP